MMMKMTLALVMVLSMVGAAGASLQLDVTGGKVTVSGKLEMDIYLALAACDGATLSNIVRGPAAPFWPDPDSIIVDFPGGCNGVALAMVSNPGEPFKEGIYMTADVTPVTLQETRYWEEKVVGEGCPEGWWYSRTFTEVMDITKGGVQLSLFSDITGEMSVIDWKSLESRTVTTTFEDHVCIPEPATLAILGLGMILIRRRNRRL
jgi:hypothetical protein